MRRAPALALAACLGAGLAAAQTRPAADARRSGLLDMAPRLQAMQTDDFQNPGMLWVADGQALWAGAAGAAAKSCADCHGEARASMRGVAARYPAIDAAIDAGSDSAPARVITLAQRIDRCRVRHQRAPPLEPESRERLALEAYVAHQSRALPIAPPDDPALAAARARGQALYRSRIGQLNLACSQCHDARAGASLGGSVIPQGHATGYPAYRLEWQGLGSLQRRLRGCMSGVRAEPYAFDAPELVDLEAYLAARAAGMPIETPALRP